MRLRENTVCLRRRMKQIYGENTKSRIDRPGKTKMQRDRNIEVSRVVLRVMRQKPNKKIKKNSSKYLSETFLN
jgi:hypothetical protein